MRNFPFPPKGKGTISYLTQQEHYLVNGGQIWKLPKGTRVNLRTTANFGIVVLQAGTKDTDGNVIPQRVFGV